VTSVQSTPDSRLAWLSFALLEQHDVPHAVTVKEVVVIPIPNKALDQQQGYVDNDSVYVFGQA
jgi:hypothetical protein